MGVVVVVVGMEVEVSRLLFVKGVVRGGACGGFVRLTFLLVAAFACQGR